MAETGVQASEQRAVYETDHPLIEHFLMLLRDTHCPPAQFRNYLRQIYILLAYEALRLAEFDAPVRAIEVETRNKLAAPGHVIESQKMAIVSVMRAGLVPAAAVHELFPRAAIAHVGVQRAHEGGPVDPPYYQNFPKGMANRHCLIAEPMVATGATAVEVLRLLKDKRGHLNNVVFLALICAPEGLLRVTSEFPEVPIITAAVDSSLSEDGMILPGIGDVGDRVYMTEPENG